MNGQERWKNRKKRRLPAVLAAIVLLAAIAAVLVWAHNDQYDQYREKNFELKRDTGYGKRVPLEEMNFNSYRKFMPAIAPAGFSPELPENVWAQTRYTDMALYDKGVFCSEDLERMLLW